MTDLYFIIEMKDGEESWRSQGYAERRLAEHFAKIKEKANPDKQYHIELRQPEGARKF